MIRPQLEQLPKSVNLFHKPRVLCKDLSVDVVVRHIKRWAVCHDRSLDNVSHSCKDLTMKHTVVSESMFQNVEFLEETIHSFMITATSHGSECRRE